MTTWEAVITILGLAVITLFTRGFFVLPNRELPYAPIGALVAIVVPEIVMNQGHLISTWKDPRLFGAAAATAWFCWRRDMLGTILSGTAVMLVLKLGLGW
jgi:branched-subunit amino acid transport protein